MIDRGWEVFVAIVVTTAEQSGPSVSDILVFREFANVFHEVVVVSLPVREVEFVIDVLPGTTPNSLA